MNITSSKLVQKIFYVGIFIIPFVYNPYFHPPYEVPKVIFFLLWVELMSVFIFLGRSHLDLDFRQYKLQYMLFAAVFLSIVIGVNPFKSLVGNYYRVDGLVTLIHLITLSIITSLIWKNNSLVKLKRSVYYSNLILITLIFVFTIFQVVNGASPLDSPINIFFGNPNFLAGYLLITSMFELPLEKERLKKQNILYLFLIFISLLLTHSRAAIFLYLIALLSFVISVSFKANIVKVTFILGVTFLVGFYAIAAAEHTPQAPFESRIRILQKSYHAFLHRPITGWGWANFDYAFENVEWQKFNDDVYVDKAHSHFLESLTTTGVLGLISYMALIIYTITNLLRRKNHNKLLVVFLVFLIHSQTNVISIAEEVFFWIVVGVASSK